MRKLIVPATFTALVLSMQGVCAQTPEQRSTLTDQREVAVTIYNDNLALVKDQRRIQLKTGATALAFRDVSARMRPETALLRSVSAPGALSVLEQNFDFDLLTPQKMLEKYVGQTVNVVRTNPATGTETTESATVLSANNGVCCKSASASRPVFPAAWCLAAYRPTCAIGPPWSCHWRTRLLRCRMWSSAT